MMHGDCVGGMAADNNESLSPMEIAEVLAYEHNGQLLCDQIDINIVAISCFSGMQLEGIISYLEGWETPVQNLRIISAASRNESARGGSLRTIGSISSDEMGEDNAEVFSYYFSLYYELIDCQREKGVEIRPPVGTFAHEGQVSGTTVAISDVSDGCKECAQDPDRGNLSIAADDSVTTNNPNDRGWADATARLREKCFDACSDTEIRTFSQNLEGSFLHPSASDEEVLVE